MAINKESTFPNFALRTHSQDHFGNTSPFKTIPQVQPTTLNDPFLQHHQPTPLTSLGTPINTFLYFADRL